MSASRFLALFAGAALACSALAQSADDAAAPDQYATAPATPATDPPARVARLAFVRGDVSFAPAGESDWVPAQLNRPLVTGDKLWTEHGARAELGIGASTIRMDQQTSFDFLNLNDQTTQVELTQGTLDIAVRRIRGGETYEVDTPTLAFVADRIGAYRVSVDAQGSTTTVSVRRGSGAIYGEGGAQVPISEGQALSFDNPQLRDYRTARVARDDFDAFAAEREQRYERAQARNYVSEDVVGYEDLDDYGSWSDAPDYGHVWYPNDVAADWAPYRDGHWAWVEPWGWTWVDDAPWGFAPFHYGRWVYTDTRWGWVPGPLDVRPVYAPALVAFVGGGGFGLSLSAGAPIGWFPLGPRDVYFPGYRCGRDYFTRVNVSNARVTYAALNTYYGGFARGNIDYARVNYAYRNRPRAITAVPATAFASSRPVAAASVALSAGMLAGTRVMPRAAVAPTRASVFAANGRAPRNARPAGMSNRAVVAARTPPPAPASFAARQRLLQRAPGQPLSSAQLHTLAAQRAQRDTRVRTIASARAALPRSDAQATPGRRGVSAGSPLGRATMHAPEMAARGNARANRGPDNTAQLRSAGYAHAHTARAGAVRQARAPMTMTARAAAAGAQHNAAAQQRQALRSSEFARARNPGARAEHRVTQAPAPHVPASQRGKPLHEQPRAATAQQQRLHSRQPSFERSAGARMPSRDVATPRAPSHALGRPVPRSENRVATDTSRQQSMRQAHQARPMAAPRAENRVTQRAQPRPAPLAAYARPSERVAAPPRAEARAPAVRFSAPPQHAPRAAASAPPQYARRQQTRPAPRAGGKRDKDERGRQ